MCDGMKPRVCICCGHPLTDKGNLFSRNPNICPSCSSLLDGMDDPAPAAGLEPAPAAPVAAPDNPAARLRKTA